MQHLPLTLNDEGLDSDQLEAVTLDVPALCVLAGAGSGKTRVLTRRVAHRISSESASEDHTLVLTFTRKAAEELRERLRALGVGDGVTAGTFHAVAYAQLRQRFADRGKVMPAISTNAVRIIEPVLEHLRLNRSTNPRAVAAEIAWAKSHALTPESYEQGLQVFRHRPAVPVNHMRKIFEGYEWEKRKRHVLDYEDLLLFLTGALRTDRQFARAQRWKFRHFFVDEFQDLNHAQFELLQTWMQRDEGPADIFLVGDSNQSIYGWNGADSSLLQNIERHVPGVHVMRLQKNYRSTSHVLAAAHAVLDAGQVLVDGGDTGTAPVVRALETDEDEATAIARAVRQAHHGNRRWTDIAVLVRTNSQRALIEAALVTFGIPFQAAGGAAWLSTPGVRGAIDELRAYSTTRLVAHVPDIETMVLEVESGVKPYLIELAKAARLCAAESPTITVSEFLTWLEVTYRFDAPALDEGARGAVTVTTFHRAKGLEWPVVFLAGVEDGLVPLGSPEGAQLEEERRLFYVAITRAREEVHLSWAKKRLTARGLQERKPSPWLVPLLKSSGAVDALDLTEEQTRSYIEQSRGQLHLEIKTPDSARAALVKWRAARMKLTGLPAKHVLTDEVIDQILEKRPVTIDQLGAIEGIGKVRAVAIGDQLLECLRTEEGVC